MATYEWIDKGFIETTLPAWRESLDNMFDGICDDIKTRTPGVVVPDELKTFCHGLFRQLTWFRPDIWVTHKELNQVLGLIDVALRRSFARTEIFERDGNREYSIISFARQMLEIPCFLNPPAHP
jgi:hypothetical protein